MIFKENIKLQFFINLAINIMNILTAHGFVYGKYKRYYTVLFGTISTFLWWFVKINKI